MAVKQKYVRLDGLLKVDAEYNILLGERSNGKSYCVKEFVLKNFKKSGGKFIYLRRYNLETKPATVEGYFRDAPVRAIFDDGSDSIKPYRGSIYLSRYDLEMEKDVRGEEIGYYMDLAGETHFKSQNFNDVTDVIFEEFVTDQGYLYREVDKLMNIISTIARRRRIRVWMIGNTISRLCPYFSEWSLSGIPKQEQGTIQVYEHETDQEDDDGNPITVKIAVYFCENSGKNSKMFFGKSTDMITKGAWQTRSYPHLPYHYRKCQNKYSILYKYKEFLFKMEVLRYHEDGIDDMMIFIHPHKKLEDGFRTISDIPSSRPLITEHLTTVTRGDKVVKMLWDQGKVFYSDNLTGSDFEAILADKGEL